MNIGRWIETAVQTGDGGQAVYIASYYGISGASGGGNLRERNQSLLALALARASSFGRVPYILAGDFNEDPLESQVILKAAQSGWWIDAVQLQFKDGKVPPT